MNETEIETVDWLNRLATQIPVETAPLVDLLRDAHRSRRRRTTLAVMGSIAAVVTIAAVTVPATSLFEDGHDDRNAQQVAHSLANYDPARMPQLMIDNSRDAFTTAYPNLGDGLFAANDEMSDSLPADFYDKAAWMSVNYRPTAAASLSVRVGHETDPSGDPLQDECDRRVDAGLYTSCRVVDVDGQQAVDSVSLVTWAGDGPRPYENLSGQRGHPVIHTPEEVPTLDPTTIWFEHTVQLTHPGGYRTLVTESVNATTLTDAQTLFRLDTDTLAKLSADPDLVIPRPPTAGPGCGSWTLKDYGHTCTTTDADTATARRVMMEEVNRTGGELTSATFRVVGGTVPHPNTDATRCSSGRLLHITLIGTFSRVVTSGPPPDLSNPSATPDATVRGILLTADAASGQVCKIGVKIGKVTPEPQSTALAVE